MKWKILFPFSFCQNPLLQVLPLEMYAQVESGFLFHILYMYTFICFQLWERAILPHGPARGFHSQ